MAFDLLDEHEQGELVQKWLRENAMSIAIGIGLGLVLIFGWQQWQAHRVRNAAEAASQYEALSAAATAKRRSNAPALECSPNMSRDLKLFVVDTGPSIALAMAESPLRRRANAN